MKQKVRTWILFGAWAALLGGASILSFLTRPDPDASGLPAAQAPKPLPAPIPDPAASPSPEAAPSSSGASVPEGSPVESDRTTERGASRGPGGGFSVRALEGESGLPLQGERLVLAIRGGAREETREVVTDSLGSASVQGLVPGLRSIEVRADGRLPARRAVEIADDREDVVEVSLRPGAALSGTVLSGTGDVVPGAYVRAALAHEGRSADGEGASGPEGAAAQVGDTGDFRLAGLRPGPWKLTAHAPGYRRTTVDVEAPSDGVHVELSRDPGFEVRVSDAAGSPVAGARVVHIGRTRGISSGVRSAITPASGKVHLDGLPDDPGEEVPLEVTQKHYRTTRLLARASVLEASGLDVTLLRGGALAGRAIGPDGAGIPGAEVRLSREGSSERPAVLAATSTGEFAFEKLEAGSYRIRVVGGARSGEATAVVEEGMTSPALEIAVTEALAAGEEIATPDEPPPRPGTIRGVIDLPEEPGAALTVRVARQDPSSVAFLRHYRFSSGDPTFRVRNVPPGTYTVEVLAGERLVASAQGVQVLSGQETDPVRLR